ncbi:hypothetical protein AMECASPLE_014339 [Ameca splendens]|uniref:Uncharacterized protein n=1 Tax=Ameca splendens TaxID=208324 RepID=A0ABV1A7X2_9TELE
MTREGGAAASGGSLTSSPQHLYHNSPQRVYGSLQWAGVGSIRKSHRLSGSLCLCFRLVGRSKQNRKARLGRFLHIFF